MPGLVARHVMLLAIVCSTVVTQIRAQESIQLQEPDVFESVETQAFHDELARIETVEGAYASALPEQLLGLGLALQKWSQHKEAITVFRRGQHVTRVNQGLYSLEQIPFIEAEITSDLAVGDFDKADRRQEYLLKVQRYSLPHGEALVQALLQQANWQQTAYELEIGGSEASVDHLQSMRDMYARAVKELLVTEKSSSARLLLPLNGLLKTQYMVSAHESRGNVRSINSSTQRARFDSRFSQSYKMGKSIIRSIYDIELASHGPNSLPVVKALVMLGDWMLWNNMRDSARKSYLDAVQELTKLDDAEVQMERIFGSPVPLPDIDGIRRLPPAAEPGDDKVLLEFGVNERGRVFDMTRLDTLEIDEKKVERLMRRIRRTKFRPSYDSEEPVVTEKILRAYDFEQQLVQ